MPGMDTMIDARALAAWNLANARARQAYRVQQGLQALPNGLASASVSVRRVAMVEWQLNLIADAELADAKAAIAETIANEALVRLGHAQLEIERLTSGQDEGQEERTALHGVRQEDQGHGVQEHGSVFGDVQGEA